MNLRYIPLVLLLIGCNTQVPKSGNNNLEVADLTITHIDPRQGYSEVVVVEANGVKTLYVSGQVGGGEDFEAQFRDAVARLLQTLDNAGASFDDVVKYTTFVVDYQPEYLYTFRAVRKELLGDTDMPASTLVGVQALGLPDWGVEIEAVAVIQD